jgi:hypothetical protein
MDGRNIQSFIFPEKGDPFRLEEMCTHCVNGHGISSYDQSFIGPNISPVKKIGSSTIKLGRDGAEDIQTSLSLYDRVGPNFAQR